MTDDDRQGEDIAGLFRKFGGDVKGYREFAPEPQIQEAAPSWRLVSGTRKGAPAQAAPEPAPAPAAPIAAPVVAPAPSPSPFAAAPASAPARPLFVRPPVAESVPPRSAPPVAAAQPVAAPVPVAAPALLPTRELDVLFARLDGQQLPQAAAPETPGLLSRWRRPS